MQKAKKYDWADSNLALFGSDTEKKVKKESAEQEPAWKDAGQDVGLKVWRIVKFKVSDWSSEAYGEFYSGDSYIVLNTYKLPDSRELLHDVHFWIGKYSTQDEYGTAAYKTVELDTYLDDKPVQHREVQGHESALFKSYFGNFTLLKGGADTGFRRVLPEQYKPRLLKVCVSSFSGKKSVQMTEMSLKRGNVTSDDVFIIDLGLKLYQYNGSKCSAKEKYEASIRVAEIDSERGGKAEVVTLEEENTSPDHHALKILAEGEVKTKSEVVKAEKKMFIVSDADGSLDMEEFASGDDVTKDKLSSEAVYIINTGDHCYCWVGSAASIDERRNGLSYASSYLNKTETPWLPISVVAQGRESADFKAAF